MYQPVPLKTNKCLVCEKEYKTNQLAQKTCSKECRLKYSGLYHGRSSKFNHLCSATVGALGEMRVGVDLLEKGFDVYRSLSPASKGDLIATKGNQVFTIEVRSGYRNKFSGKIISNFKKHGEISLFAIYVSINDEIIYYDATSMEKIEL